MPEIVNDVKLNAIYSNLGASFKKLPLYKKALMFCLSFSLARALAKIEPNTDCTVAKAEHLIDCFEGAWFLSTAFSILTKDIISNLYAHAGKYTHFYFKSLEDLNNQQVIKCGDAFSQYMSKIQKTPIVVCYSLEQYQEYINTKHAVARVAVCGLYLSRIDVREISDVALHCGWTTGSSSLRQIMTDRETDAIDSRHPTTILAFEEIRSTKHDAATVQAPRGSLATHPIHTPPLFSPQAQPDVNLSPYSHLLI